MSLCRTASLALVPSDVGLASLRGDLAGQVAAASACIDTFLDYNLQPGVARNLLAARREMQGVQASIAAAITIAELEGN